MEQQENIGMVLHTTREGVTHWLSPLQARRIELGMTQCDLCLDSGIIHHTKYGNMTCPRTDCITGNEHRSEQWDGMIKNADVPKEYQKFTFDTWKQQVTGSVLAGKQNGLIAAQMYAERRQIQYYDLLDACQLAHGDKVDRIAKSLVLWGPNGTGKTGLMISTAQRLMETGFSVVYVKVSKLFDKLHDSFEKGNDALLSAVEIMERYQHSHILLLDECNVEMKPSYSYYRQQIENLLRHRYENDLPTVITMNLSPKQFEEEWGKRTASVVIDMAIWVRVHGPTLRSTDEGI